jgi:hypothetical protein
MTRTANSPSLCWRFFISPGSRSSHWQHATGGRAADIEITLLNFTNLAGLTVGVVVR